MNRCIECGYALVGRVRGVRCPECGAESLAIQLEGGLADGGARCARAASRLAWVLAGLLWFASIALLLVLLRFGSERTEMVLALCWQHARVAALCVGAWLVAVVARMLPRESAWSRAMWLTALARVAWALLFEASIVGQAPRGILLFVAEAELPVGLGLDLLVALAVLRIAPTGGLPRAGAAPIARAAGASAGASVLGLAIVCFAWSPQLDPSAWAIAAIPLCSGALGAIAGALALWRIKCALHAQGQLH